MPYFEALFARFEWQNYTRADRELAAAWWAQRKAQGRPVGDADLLMRAVAARRWSRIMRRTSTARTYRSKTGSRIDPGIFQLAAEN